LTYGNQQNLMAAFQIAEIIGHVVFAHSLTRLWACPGAGMTEKPMRGLIADALRDFMNAIAREQVSN